MWFAGIDWADQHHDVVVLDADGQPVGQMQVAHSAEGLEHLTTFLRTLAPESDPATHVACLVETNQGLLIAALLEAGLSVYPVNPTAIEGLRPPSGVKTDQLDALLLARKGRSDWPHLRVLRPDSPLLAELKTLTRDLQSLIQEQTRLVNQLTTCLKAYYPAALQCFDGVTRQVTRTFLHAFPTPEQACAARVENLEQVLRSVHYPHPADQARRLVSLLQQPRLQAIPGVALAKSRFMLVLFMLVLLAQHDLVLEQIAAYDQAIHSVSHQHADAALFASLPGAGPRLAPCLLAEWGEDRERYAGAASVQALAGTAPVTMQSGKWHRVRRRTACVNSFRQALYHLARESVLFEPWAKTYYTRKRSEGKTHAMALRALAHHWVRIMYAMWTRQELYRAETFVTAQRAHAGLKQENG